MQTVLKCKINHYFTHKHWVPILGEGSPMWEKFPHFLVVFVWKVSLLEERERKRGYGEREWEFLPEMQEEEEVWGGIRGREGMVTVNNMIQNNIWTWGSNYCTFLDFGNGFLDPLPHMDTTSSSSSFSSCWRLQTLHLSFITPCASFNIERRGAKMAYCAN